MCQSQSCVRCVLACTSPVAVRVAVKLFEQTRMADCSLRVIIEALQGYAPGLQVPAI